MISNQSFFSIFTKHFMLCMVLSFFSFVIAQIYPCEFWIDIEPDVQAALEELGYTQETWDSPLDLYVTTSCVLWEDLTQEQQDAAVVIGFAEDTWDDLVDDPINCPIEWVDCLFYADLPEFLKEAAMDLGYTEESWDAGERLEYECLFWAEMTATQQAALEIFGYTELVIMIVTILIHALFH